MGEPDFQTQVLTMLTGIQANLAGVSERVARIEAGNEERCKARGDLLEDLRECHDDHETRIRVLEKQDPRDDHEERIQALEKRERYAAGIGAGVGAMVGASVSVAARVFFGK